MKTDDEKLRATAWARLDAIAKGLLHWPYDGDLTNPDPGSEAQKLRGYLRIVLDDAIELAKLRGGVAGEDWTVDPATGRCNSSPHFQQLTDRVESLIANCRLGDHPRGHAGLIMAQLAHVHGLAPTRPYDPSVKDT